MSKRTGRGRRRTSNPQRAIRPVGAAARRRTGDSTQGEAGSFRSPLARLLDAPHLARMVPHLAPEALHQIIRHCGLDACGELVGSATPAQLASVFDLDLWRSARPGHEEGFDADRFGEWLELLADTPGTVAARTVAAMDVHLVTAGLSHYVRVFDLAVIAPPTAIDGEPIDIDVTPHGGVECDVGGYRVRAIRSDAWDAIVALLLALDADHQALFHALMQGCRRLSNSTPETDGLDDRLTEPEQLLHDVARDREHRRSQQGYSTPADARAFLQMARQRRRPSNGEPSINPLVAVYFRAADDTAASGAPDVPRCAPVLPATLAGVPETPDAVVDMLAMVGLVPERPRALLERTHSEPSRLALIRTLMEYVRDSDDTVYLARNRELAFLANTLMAGCSIQSRSFTPQEASDAAVGVCNLGLEHWSSRWPETHGPQAAPTADLGVTLPASFLRDHDLVTAFEVGWAVLHAICLFVAEQLIFALSDLRCSDADIQEGLDTLRIELAKQREAGTPWRARTALEVIAMLDLPAWASVLGLLDECPVIPAALTATLEGRTRAVSATEFEFISTCSQLDTVREFMARLLDTLSR